MNYRPLGEVSEFINGVAFKPTDWGEEGLKIIRIQNLNDPSKPYNRTKRTVDQKYLIKPGDLLVSWSASLGVFEWKDSEAGLLNQHIFKCVPKDNSISKDYLRFVLIEALKKMQSHLHGATMQHVNRGDFIGTKVFVPPPDEQNRIVNILKTSETLIEKRRQAVEKINSLSQAIFLEMFGDPKNNEKKWPIDSVGNVVDCIVPGRDKPKSFTGDVPWVTTADLVDLGITIKSRNSLCLSQSEIDEVRARKIPAGSVIMSCVGDLGVLSIAGVEMVVNQQLHTFQCNKKINNVFLLHCLSFQKAYMKMKASSTTLPYMNKSICNSIPIFIPPIELQEQFAGKVTQIRNILSIQNKFEVEVLKLTSSLQQSFFGENGE